MVSFSAALESKTQLSPNILSLVFSPFPDSLTFTAGQYLILKIPLENGETVSRLYSIASKDGSVSRFELIIEIIEGGLASEYFKRLDVGGRVDFQGPAGRFSFQSRALPIVFLATGSGIAPVLSMVESNISRLNQPCLLLWGIRFKNQIVFLERFKRLSAANSNFSYVYCLSKEKDLNFAEGEEKKHYFLGRIDAGLANLVVGPGKADYYLCGRREVVESLKKLLIGLSVPKTSIFYEKF